MSITKRLRHLLCRWLDWHERSRGVTFDGLTFHSRCKHCSKRISLDSQGNWFWVGDDPRKERS